MVATTTDKKIRDLGSTGPAVALTTFSMRPLISTDDVPRLACVYPTTSLETTKHFKANLLKAEVPLTSLSGFATDPFAPADTSKAVGFSNSGTAGGTSGDFLLSERARHTREYPTPCGTGVILGPAVLAPAPKRKHHG